MVWSKAKWDGVKVGRVEWGIINEAGRWYVVELFGEEVEWITNVLT